MNYSKPELVVLGDATSMIGGTKAGLPEPDNNNKLQGSSFEMED